MLEIKYLDPKQLKENKYSRDLFPTLKGDAYEMLEKDIMETGIRTPLEITKDNMVLCGHERLRIALKLNLKEVPVTYFPSDSELEQHIRIIKDNLARKSVEFRTKMRCYEELTEIYGLIRGELGKEQVKAGIKGFQSVNRSEERLALSEDEIAHEVGFSAETFKRAKKIETSDLPEQIKSAAFDGRLSIRPVADLVDESEEVKSKVVPDVLKRLKNDEDKFSVETMTRDAKQEFAIQKAMQQIGVPSVEEQVKNFYGKLSPPTGNKKADVDHEELVQHINGFIERTKLACPICGERKIQWKCGHDFK